MTEILDSLLLESWLDVPLELGGSLLLLGGSLELGGSLGGQ